MSANQRPKFSLSMLKIPSRLDSETQKRIEAKIRKYAHPDHLRAEWHYVTRHIKRCTSRLREHEPDWPAPLGIAAERIYSIVSRRLKGEGEIDIACTHLLGAALFYLCNPEDEIPDYVPAVGYDDDAHAFNYVFAQIRKLHQNSHDFILKTLNADY